MNEVAVPIAFPTPPIIAPNPIIFPVTASESQQVFE
nr:MAG TPA: hypothetical protein [Microviridae sp.]